MRLSGDDTKNNIYYDFFLSLMMENVTFLIFCFLISKFRQEMEIFKKIENYGKKGISERKNLLSGNEHAVDDAESSDEEGELQYPRGVGPGEVT